MVTTRPPKTIVKPTALGPVANTDTKLLIYGLFQKGRVLAQDGDGRAGQARCCARASAQDMRPLPLSSHGSGSAADVEVDPDVMPPRGQSRARSHRRAPS